MADYVELLAERAFRIVPGAAYNRVLEELTGRPDGERQIFYEVALGEGKPWEWLRDRVYPAFAGYLKNKSIDPENPEGVTVSVFHRDRCYLLSGRDFLRVFQEMEGLNAAAFHFRVLQWLANGGC